MGPPSYMRSAVKRKVLMRRITVYIQKQPAVYLLRVGILWIFSKQIQGSHYKQEATDCFLC